MLTAIALDDEPVALDIIRHYVLKVPFVKLKAEFTDVFEAMDYLQKEQIDLLFIDINMPDMLGTDFVNILNKKIMVIFITGYSEHAVKSFELNAIDYLLKPFALPRFLQACNKARELQNLNSLTKDEGFLFLKVGYDKIKVCFEEICYLEAAGNYINFVLKNRSLLARMTFVELNAVLPEGKFIRVHRCYIVPVNKIEKVERHQVKIGDKKIPIGENFMHVIAKL